MNTISLCLMLTAFTEMQPPETPVIDTLVESLKDPDVEIRMYACLALVQLGPSVLEPLVKALEGPDKFARAGAAYAIGQLGVDGLPAKQRLLKALKDNEKDVRRQAAYALSRLLSAE